MAFAILPQQSPIDLGAARPIAYSFPEGSFVIRWETLHHGCLDMQGAHGPEVIFSDDPKVGVDLLVPGRDRPTFFALKALHFHSPSEHKVSGRDWPLELHVVHQTTEPDPFNPGANRTVFAVLGIMIEHGPGDEKTDRFFKGLTEHLKEGAARNLKSLTVSDPLDPRILLPDDPGRYWRYEGSLTTDIAGPNGGFVSWVVFQDTKKVSADVLNDYIDRLAHEHKPIQDLDRRYVFFNPGGRLEMA